ncbi:SDR family oxidoreductase [Pseudonocardia sp. TRM90224]|uniref:SDR family oxidoreductase n=1 Tax=Pseudonocardia sp. TRM90224 TaxID=2812678 RepID=UPI001E3CC9BF|nr:SDR family oxidoreductase [Pseudonocardia sp. TRM90224]
MGLIGERVLVLGGTSGIGQATAALAAAEGAQVVVASSRRTSIDRALAELPAGTTGEVADLADPAAVAALFERVGAVDHLVFTAGEPLTLMSVDGMDMDAARAAFGLRFFGALNAVSVGARHVRSGGSITLTTGIAAERPGAGWSVAASICGAVVSLVRALAVELAPLRVNGVSPGIVRSPLWAGMDDAAREQMYADTAKALPVGRVGEPGDIAQVYVHLMEQHFTTGTTITADGGALLV